MVSCQHGLCLLGTDGKSKSPRVGADGADQMLKVVASERAAMSSAKSRSDNGCLQTLILGRQPQDPVCGNSKQEGRQGAPLSHASGHLEPVTAAFFRPGVRHNGSAKKNNIQAMAFKLRMTVDVCMTNDMIKRSFR